MKKLLSSKFYDNLKNVVFDRLENKNNKSILENVDWEQEAQKCFTSLSTFFKNINIERLHTNGIDTIGVIDICWNEYGSDIEVDFMPNNDFDTAFDDGCIMNNSAIDNDNFFSLHFNTTGEESWQKIGDDYQEIILIFYYLIEDIIEAITQQKVFKNLPLKSPCHIGFASFHDEERTKIFTLV
ncbi:hypothetical protein [Aquimarina sediminis]|uniref:hypothetical protein n=1 Tax=Aquimarina sediminis TaxID=2070536 RepID=UPI000CA05386|nr:hypothetical protein [Aquimarina sediminis]